MSPGERSFAGAPSLHRGDPLFRLLLDRWGLAERGMAVLTVAVGFGALALWYLGTLLFFPALRCMRGMFEYYSATVGDLILLPVLNALALRYARAVIPGVAAVVRASAASERHAARLLRLVDRLYNARKGLVFVLAIAASVVAWQRFDELYGLDRNWTVPVWGQPRLVAWYHQAFFGFEAYLMAYLVYRHTLTWHLLRRLARRPAAQPIVSALADRSARLFGWILLSWGAFVSLRLLDFFRFGSVVHPTSLFSLPAPITTAAFYYAVLVGAGLWPLMMSVRQPGAQFDRRPALRLAAAAAVAPVVGPIARVLLACVTGA